MDTSHQPSGPGADPAEPVEPPDPAAASAPPASRGRRRTLDRRTIAICVCIALVAAIAAGLVASVVIDDDGGTAAADETGLDLSSPVDTDTLLDTELLTIDGADTSLRDQLGEQPMVVNLWAQSCAPCVKEMPLLEAASKANPDIDFLGVDTQDRLDNALVMAERTGITYPWVQDPKGEFFYEARASGMPTTLIVNPQGAVIAAKTGQFDSGAELQQWLDTYLG